MKACSCSYAFRPYPDFTTSWAELNALALLLGACCGTALDATALYDFEIAPEIVRGGGSTANSVLCCWQAVVIKIFLIENPVSLFMGTVVQGTGSG